MYGASALTFGFELHQIRVQESASGLQKLKANWGKNLTVMQITGNIVGTVEGVTIMLVHLFKVRETWPCMHTVPPYNNTIF